MADPRVGAAIRTGFPGQGGDTPGRAGLPPSATGQRPRDEPDRAPPPETRHPEQRERHLGPLAEGREWWCVGFTEPLAGSDLANIKTRAESAGRRLRPDRPEGLRRMGPTLGLVPPAGPHGERVDGTRRADLVPAGHVDARPLPQPRRVHHGPHLRRDISRRRRSPRVRNPWDHGAGVGHRRRVPDGSPVRLRAYRLGPKDA